VAVALLWRSERRLAGWLPGALVLPALLAASAGARGAAGGAGVHTFAAGSDASVLVALAVIAGVLGIVAARHLAEPRMLVDGADAPPVVRPVRRPGRMALLAGTALGGIALAGNALARQPARRVSIASGDAVTVADRFGRSWTLANQGISRYDEETGGVTALALELAAPRGGARLVRVEVRAYVDSRGAPLGTTAVPTVLSGLLQDVRLVVEGVAPDEQVTLRVEFLPLLSLVWVAGALVLIGGAVTWWPPPESS
jgi:hypothetical protein